LAVALMSRRRRGACSGAGRSPNRRNTSKPLLGERVEKRFRVVPVAPAVLHPGDLRRIGGEQALDEPEVIGTCATGGMWLDVHPQPRVAHALDDFREAPEQPVVRSRLCSKRAAASARRRTRPSSRGRSAAPSRSARSSRCPASSARGRARPRPADRAARSSLRRERVRFRVRPEDGQAHVLGEKPAAVAHEALGIGREVRAERGHDRESTPVIRGTSVTVSPSCQRVRKASPRTGYKIAASDAICEGRGNRVRSGHRR